MFQHFAASITKQILTSVEVFVSQSCDTTTDQHTTHYHSLNLLLPQGNSGALLRNEEFTVEGETGLQRKDSHIDFHYNVVVDFVFGMLLSKSETRRRIPIKSGGSASHGSKEELN